MRNIGDSGTNSIPSNSTMEGVTPMIEMVLQCKKSPRMLVNKTPNAMFSVKKKPVTPRTFGVDTSSID